MAPDLDPYLSKVIPKPKNTSLVWELVDKMMQQSRSVRIPKVSVCLGAWIPTFPKWSQSLSFQVWSGSWWSKCCNRADQLEIQNLNIALGLDPYFPKMVPKLIFPGLVWELVVNMLQPSRSIRNPQVSVWLWTWTLTFPKWPQSLKFQVGLVSWRSECCNRSDQLEIQKSRYDSGPGPLLFPNDPNAQLYRFGLGAGCQNDATEKIN
jgi:hypothetical protein